MKIFLLLFISNIVCIFSYYLRFNVFKYQERINSIKNSIDIDNNKRKTHKNKYSNFSSKVIDPLEEAMEKQNDVKNYKKKEILIVERGTTIPSNNLEINQTSKAIKTNFKKYSNIIPSDPYTFGYVNIGVILGPHGVKGELKVTLDTDFADYRLSNDSIVYIKKPNRLTPRPIKVIKSRKQIDNLYLVTLDQVNSRFIAASFKDYQIFVKSNDRPNLNADEYLIRDLVDIPCYLLVNDNMNYNKYKRSDGSTITISNNPIGLVIGVIPPDELCESSASVYMHSMLEIKKINTEELCLIPFVPSIVIDVDITNQMIILDVPDGLLDLTYIENKKVVIRGFLPSKAIGLTDTDRLQIQNSQIFI